MLCQILIDGLSGGEGFLEVRIEGDLGAGMDEVELAVSEPEGPHHIASAQGPRDPLVDREALIEAALTRACMPVIDVARDLKGALVCCVGVSHRLGNTLSLGLSHMPLCRLSELRGITEVENEPHEGVGVTAALSDKIMDGSRIDISVTTHIVFTGTLDELTSDGRLRDFFG